jgi:glyoxylase I family protein
MSSASTRLFTGIDHPAISCRDVPAMIKWYCDTFDLAVLGDDGKEPASYVLGFGGSPAEGPMIELMPVRQPGPRPEEQPRFCQGLRHVAVRVSDFAAAYARVKSAGGQFLFEPVSAVGGGKVVSFRDPEGNELQIVQRCAM